MIIEESLDKHDKDGDINETARELESRFFFQK